jgi:amino acid adenylation domain-containing protein
MTVPENAIAIVGLAGKFPGADDVDQFWHNVRNGVSSITRFSDAELEDAFPRDVRGDANFVRARPILRNVDQFDADFFGMLPREAALTDPQHRLLLECAWSALEDGGYDPSRFPGAIGVFAGCSMDTYLLRNVLTERLDPDRFTSDYQVGSYDALLGALPDTLATRISYKLNLRGPAMTVQSACSTSLLAVAQACQSLLLYQSDMALAGGVSITFPQKRGYLHQEGGMVSPDGICRPFDADAAGTIFGDGAAIVLLKRLADAIDDGDHIYAVIRGSAVNNDGSDKVGFTAPSVGGQAEVIASALAASDVEASSIGYVECHGTATPLGDPIEFAGLVRGFGSGPVEQPYCALGSVKANVGHLDVASGVTGLIKAALALHHREIPPLANFHKPNRHIDLAGSPFSFPTVAGAWPKGSTPRRAGVSSFGVGGTNVHVVLEEAPPTARSKAPLRESATHKHVLPLSARTDTALAATAAALANELERNPEVALDDVAYTLQTGRRGFDRRTAVTCASREQAIAALRALPAPAPASTGSARLVFMFPGQGAQFPGMANPLYRDHASFRAVIDEGIAIATPIVGADLRAQLLEPDATGGAATLLAQPALFIFEYALARLWISWGLKPDAMVGHSVGEFVAACLAGVFSFEEGCRLVATRARIMQAMAPGGMLAVRLSETDLRVEMGDALDVAAINAPSLCVASGPLKEVEALNDRLTAKGVSCRLLAVSHAFHSRALDPAVAQIESAAGGVQLTPPRIPFASCVTGGWADAAQAIDPKYWARHCRAPVRFADALSTVTQDGRPFLLEVGPGRTLSSLAAQIVNRNKLGGVAASLEDADADGLSAPLAALWTAGFTPDWTATTEQHGRRVRLPTYPFQRSRHWIERADRPGTAASPSAPQHPEPTAAPLSEISAVLAAPAALSTSRLAKLQSEVIGILEHLSGASDIDLQTHFVELGFDSLLLGQVARALEKKFHIRITFRQLLKEMSSAALLAAYLDSTLPPEEAPATSEAPIPAPDAGGPAAADGLPAILQAQLQTMHAVFAEQLRALQAQATPAAATPPASRPAPTGDTGARVRLYQPSASKASTTLAESQRAYIEDLVKRVNARTPLAKSRTQQDRAVLADPRTVAGFRQEWKELVYPVVAARAKGSKIWDIDGNEYVDLVNGYGQTMFGHSPDFVTSAVAAQLQDGFPIGPQSPLAGEVAALVSELTGDERVTFCNTGSEAVMAAMRVARAVTGRERVVVFGNDYHGQFDEVLVKASGGATRRALPVAPGIPPEAVANMTVLPYGDPQSLDWIEANGDDIAAVLVEPVQSRHPALRPQAFLQRLRAITETKGAALVFDEIVTGFRAHPGGMQALFGIRADLATYGKVVGGGMPVGILAGKAQFMDALDGGTWRFGDDSVPEVAPTFFAGTFVRHPLVLAATKAVLMHLKAEGPALQERLAARMAGLVDAVNRDLQRRGLATRAEGFSSWFYLNFAADGALASLFWPQMRLLGVHVQEGYPCFLTTAHSDADIAAIEKAFGASLDALQAAGIMEAAPTVAAPAVEAAAGVESAPLTEPQLEILTAAQMSDEASCAFNESVSIVLGGEIDSPALATALNAVIARHQALRGRIGRSDERMYFAAALALAPELQDFSREHDPDAALAALVAADARTPFDLWTGPLVRAALVRLAADRHVLVFTAHHIVCDGWSVNIILGDLATQYRMSREGQSAALPAAPHFSQYALAQAASKDSRATDLRYWTTLFADAPSLPDLPTDRARPALRSYAGATYSTHFGAELHASLKKAGATQGATLFSVLFTALQAVLGRLSGSSDIVIGVPAAGQSLDDEPGLVGHCVHMLPFRAPLVWDASFAAHVKAVAHRLLDGFDHAKCTYGTLVRALPLQRVANRLPLTEFQFNLERVAEDLDFGGLTVKIAPNAKAAVNFDIFVNVIESSAGLRIDCDYNTDLFDEATITRWMTHYRRTLEGICAAPETPMSALPVLSIEQEHFVLDTVNDSAARYPHESCVHELFAAQAAKTPDAIACIDGTGVMSYAELDRQSTRLAQEILGVSIVRRGRIAIATDRSRALPVSLLAAMKSGHAYVPLDVNQPLERLRQIATAAQIDAIICQDERIRSIAPYAVALRLDRLNLGERLEGHALPRVSSDDSAYILFTSGSTGMPKGVEVGHRALTNVICDVARRCDVSTADVVIASSAITFDVAATELYAPLIAGGHVVMASVEEVRTGFELVALAKRVGATLMQATPTLWRMLLEAGFSSHPGLKLITAGEAVSRDVVDRLLSGGGRLWNLYGPTEAAIYSSGYEMRVDDASVTIGRPLANVQLYVLDDRGEIAPPGAVGNLFIGGDGLAKGYFDRTDLTEQAFKTVSLAGRLPRRLYRSGDLARLLPSGDFELRGRIDHQVKLRGFRIELGEIETVLRRIPGIQDCAVMLRNDAGPDPALVAYVVAADTIRPAELATQLSGLLPDYMVPARWLELEALPLTPNGKVDRNALPPLALAEAAAPTTSPPRTSLETRIAAVWARVIGLQQVGTRDPLFTLGADSLQVFRIAAQFDKEGIAIGARELMKNPTVAALAKLVESKPETSSDAPVPKGPSLADFRKGARRHTVTP